MIPLLKSFIKFKFYNIFTKSNIKKISFLLTAYLKTEFCFIKKI
ncbi:hypothetical protein LEP1GSC021_2354 [Leptospira noguchii str. 1993005606]|uniref:SLEI domain protein, PF07620 family n=1 Tax=Leptospira noguchii str. 2007001578 TaxID=1049974 RepID=A0ABN0J2F0_9LEPT|nr:hypothetical protein LEP1GSC035_2805 [Leptospira noguchii str. 2007001578]EPE84319.1 hypothetical protein LEP1GSC021_2354 [Leptospira noguchii str. 1993005606]